MGIPEYQPGLEIGLPFHFVTCIAFSKLKKPGEGFGHPPR